MLTIEPVVGNDALPLEYKLKYGCARRHVDYADFVNDPLSLRVSGPNERRPEEKAVRFVGVNVCPIADNLRPTLAGKVDHVPDRVHLPDVVRR